MNHPLILLNRKRVAFLTTNKLLADFCLNLQKKILSKRRARTRVCGENKITMDYVKGEESIRLTHVKISMASLY